MRINPNGRVVAFVAIVILVGGYALGFRFGHPHDGLSNGLGSAQSGVVLYRVGNESTVGSKVIVSFSKPHQTPVLAVIAGNQKDSIAIQTGTKLESIKANQIQGRLLIVIPFIGAVLNIVGL